MRRWTCLVGALVFAVAVGACRDETGDTTTTTTVATRTIPTAAQLEAMLLTADDIEGWEDAVPLDGESLAAWAQLPCASVNLDPAIAERLTADAGVDLHRGAGTTEASLVEFLVAGDAEQLSADLDAYRDAFDSCVTTMSTSADTPTSFDELTLPELGDQQWAILRASDGSHTYGAYVRVGTVAVVLGVSTTPSSRSATRTSCNSSRRPSPRSAAERPVVRVEHRRTRALPTVAEALSSLPITGTRKIADATSADAAPRAPSAAPGSVRRACAVISRVAT